MVKLCIRMRTVTHYATESDRMDPIYGTFIRCECGKRAVTRDEIARMHQRSAAVVPGVSVVES